MKLSKGQTYNNRHDLIFVGWTAGDGSGTEGYYVDYYFDSEGRYLGGDEHGIEPEFEG